MLLYGSSSDIVLDTIKPISTCSIDEPCRTGTGCHRPNLAEFSAASHVIQSTVSEALVVL